MYDEAKAKRAVNFFNSLKHTKGKWKGVPFDLLPWQDKVISDIFGWNGTVIAWAIAALLGTVLCLAPSKIWTRFKDC